MTISGPAAVNFKLVKNFMICPGQGQSCAACHMANNYLVCRANLIQDLELILRVQQLLWRWRLCCFLFDGGFIKVSVIVGCRGWHCDILWLCNRPSFQPLLSCFAIHSPVLSLSLLEHNLLHCIYCDNVSRGWMKEGGRGPYILFICCFDTHIIPKRSERELLFIPSSFKISDTCVNMFSPRNG